MSTPTVAHTATPSSPSNPFYSCPTPVSSNNLTPLPISPRQQQISAPSYFSYLTIQEVLKLLSGKNEECSFSTMCVNVRSLTNRHNFTKFESLIAGLDYQPHIIAVNETWDKPHTTGQHINLNGYVYISNPRVASRGGDVGMYIKQSLIFTPYAELSIMHEKRFESLFVTTHLKVKG